MAGALFSRITDFILWEPTVQSWLWIHVLPAKHPLASFDEQPLRNKRKTRACHLNGNGAQTCIWRDDALGQVTNFDFTASADVFVDKLTTVYIGGAQNLGSGRHAYLRKMNKKEKRRMPFYGEDSRSWEPWQITRMSGKWRKIHFLFLRCKYKKS